MKKISVASTFSINAPQTFTVDAFVDDQHPLIPPKTDYVFRKDHVRDLLAFLSKPYGDAYYLTGPTGSGKTSLVCQIAARLNYPVQQITCHGRLDFNDLVGQFMMSNGSMTFVHGPLSVALRDGHILILNEIDLMDPSELAGLNDIIEGNSLTIPQNNREVIKHHAHFRLIVTGNSAGQGDASGLYSGVMQQNLAFMDRFRMMVVDYPEPSVEKAILNQRLEALGVPLDSVIDVVIDNMIKVANEIRQLFMGSVDGVGALTVTMSTRTLIRWLNIMVNFRRAKNVLPYSLERALSFRAEPAQREAIHRIAKDIFGHDWEMA
jgi:cobaltochelatase CobS